MPPRAVHVVGLNGMLRAFAEADKTLRDDLKDALQEAAQPVRGAAQQLAGTRIRHMGVGRPWARMRVGQSGSIVYVAPVERGVKGRGGQRLRRPNLADLMMDRAMEPALEGHQEQVIQRLDKLIDEVIDVWTRQPL